MDRLVDLLRNHQRGAFRPEEITILLCQLATEEPPERLAPAIPSELLDEVRQYSADPPEDPNRVRVYYVSRLGDTDPDWNSYIEKQSRRLFDGMWRWHRYFTDA